MMSILEQMLQNYNPKTIYDKKNAMKEIIQEIILCGLSRSGFFEEAAFYGGTALRIFYGLDRFSEDLDFSLLKPDAGFSLTKYFPMLEKEVRSFGLNMEIQEKAKSSDSAIRSAFLKGNTKEHMLLFYANDQSLSTIPKDERIKIKFEIDTNPPEGANYEQQYRLNPAPYAVQLYDMPSLFAGKLHAVICRAWKNRVKGRDLYDYVFYLSKGAGVNAEHLRQRLIQSNFLTVDAPFDIDIIKEILNYRFDQIDFEQAKEDVAPFIHDTKMLNLWSADFFKSITQNLKIE